MLSEPKWTFDLYLRAAREQRIAAGAHGWRLKLLPWLRNNPVVQQIETHDRVVAAMLPSDRADPATLGAEAKNKIAQRSGCTLQQVNSVIKQADSPPPLLFPPRATCSSYLLNIYSLASVLFASGDGQPRHARMDAAAQRCRPPYPPKPRGHGKDCYAARQLDVQSFHKAAVVSCFA